MATFFFEIVHNNKDERREKKNRGETIPFYSSKINNSILLNENNFNGKSISKITIKRIGSTDKCLNELRSQ